MSSTWNLIEHSQGELKVTVNGDAWKTAQTKATDKLVKKVKIDGFREGQAPKALAIKHIGAQNILMEAVEAVAQDALMAGIEEHKIELIARPELKLDDMNETEVKLTFVITVKPEVTLGEYKGLKITKDEAVVSDEEVEAKVAELQAKFADMIVKEDGVVENGDTAIIDFEGFKDGVAFEGGKGESYPLEIGSNSFIPGFEEQVIGFKSEETKDINVTFPAEYGAPDLAGADVVFKVTVHEIKTKELPAADDELVKQAEIEGVATIEEYKANQKEALLNAKKQEANNKYNGAILDAIIASSTVDIPEAMIEDETDTLMRDFDQRLQQQGFGMDQFMQMTGQDEKAMRAQMRNDAVQKVNVRLVLDAIAKKENIEISEEDINKELETISKMYSMDLEEVKKRISNEAITYDLRIRRAMELVEKAIIA
ncbi:MAG: trigger factor [Erysipelotrichaceae bacterium]